MRTFLLAAAMVFGVLTIAPTIDGLPTSTVGVVALDAHALELQQTQPPPAAPQINVEIKREGGGGRWYMSPVWMAIGALSVVLLLVLLAMAFKGNNQGGTTVVRG